MDEPRTVDSVLAKLESHVSQSAILPPTTWIDAALALTALLGDETDKLFLAQQLLAQKKAKIVEEGKSVASANLTIQGSDEWVNMKRQEAKISRVEEMIRCAKIRARLADSELHQ
jgi:hypothetical protein